MKKRLFIILITIIMVGEIANAKGLTAKQRDNADIVAEFAYNEWDRYGILPSVAVCQALNESSLGVNCDDYNWFGIKGAITGERLTYNTLSSCIYSYLRIFQQDRYRVVKITDHDKQVRQIIKGGYNSEDGYYEDMVSLYNKYNLEKYNNKLLTELEHKEQVRSLNEWQDQRGKRLRRMIRGD